MQPDNIELEKVRYPVLAEKKIDGVKIVVKDGVFLSRALKPIRNEWLVDQLKFLFRNRYKLFDFEGEVQVGGLFKDSSSFVMKNGKEVNNWVFHMFDYIPKESELELDTIHRKQRLENIFSDLVGEHLQIVDGELFNNEEDLLNYHAINAADPSLDGTIVRQPHSVYKFGRSRNKVGEVLKLKDFDDDEAIIIGFEERMHNTNEAETNELGRTFRSSSKDGLVGTYMLGAFICKWRDVEFKVGTGFSHEQAEDYWVNQDALKGELLKFQYMGVGVKGRPRHPSFLGFRSKEDMDND